MPGGAWFFADRVAQPSGATNKTASASRCLSMGRDFSARFSGRSTAVPGVVGGALLAPALAACSLRSLGAHVRERRFAPAHRYLEGLASTIEGLLGAGERTGRFEPAG